MNGLFKSSLQKVIQKWIDEQSCEDEWLDVGYVGDNLAELMANAAGAVLDCCTDIQKYHEREKNLK